MKEFKIYTKGLEYGGMVAAYSVETVDGSHVAHGAKKFGYVIDGVEIPANKGHYVMEIIAAWSGLVKVEEGSKVTIYTNDKVAKAKMARQDDEMPYGYFIKWIDDVIKSKHLTVDYEWVGQRSCSVIANFVKPMAVSAQKS